MALSSFSSSGVKTRLRMPNHPSRRSSLSSFASFRRNFESSTGRTGAPRTSLSLTECFGAAAMAPGPGAKSRASKPKMPGGAAVSKTLAAATAAPLRPLPVPCRWGPLKYSCSGPTPTSRLSSQRSCTADMRLAAELSKAVLTACSAMPSKSISLSLSSSSSSSSASSASSSPSSSSSLSASSLSTFMPTGVWQGSEPPHYSLNSASTPWT
mmetsp:Transcript_27016/g.57244  ORF Transcript_27016/g.57244 Transcript_27016/m.57244 type:complete len:211 (-) Transcript_27016:2-634(-)